MHEFGVVSSLLQGLESKAAELGARRIVAIHLLIGDRASIVDDSFRFYFDALSAGTVAEGATIHVRRVPTRFYCAHCEAHYEPVGGTFRCPSCGTTGEITAEGSEFLVESIAVER